MAMNLIRLASLCAAFVAAINPLIAQRTILPVVYINAPTSDYYYFDVMVKVPLPGDCDCYNISVNNRAFSLTSTFSDDDLCAFNFEPGRFYDGDGADFVRFTPKNGCEGYELVAVFFWNPALPQGWIRDPQRFGACGIPGLKVNCGTTASASNNLVCNPGIGGYNFFSIPTALDLNTVPSWFIAAGAPVWSCTNPFSLNNGVLDLNGRTPDLGDAVATNLKTAPAGARQYLLTYTRAGLTGNTTLEEFRTVLTEGLQARENAQYDLNQDPVFQNGRVLFNDPKITGEAPARRVSVLTTLNRPPRQLVFQARQGSPNWGIHARVTLDQVEFLPFPLPDTSVRTVACGSVNQLNAPVSYSPANSTWEWYQGNNLVGTGLRFTTTPVYGQANYRVCLNTGATVKSGGDLCYPFRLQAALPCADPCADFLAAVDTAQIRVDTAGGITRLSLSATLTNSDALQWDFGCDGTVEHNTTGNVILALTNPPRTDLVCATIRRADCQVQLSRRYNFVPAVAACSCSDFPPEVMRNFDFTVRDQTVTFTPRGQLLSECDQVTWSFGDGSVPVRSQGREAVTYRYYFGTMFNVCMSVQRFDRKENKNCITMRVCRMVMLPEWQPAPGTGTPATTHTYVSNPASETAWVRLGSDFEASHTTLSLFDLNGRLVLREKALSTQHSLSVGHLAKGMYMLSIQSDARRETVKLVVE
jgi:Secretion system C-terminal sorting domain